MNTHVNTLEVDAMRAVYSPTLAGLAAIRQPDVNIAIWQRSLSPTITSYVQHCLTQQVWPGLELTSAVAMLPERLRQALPTEWGCADFVSDVVQLAEAMAEVSACQQVSVRLVRLDDTMCPRFHADNNSCRLLCTYAGVGTEWLPDGEPESAAAIQHLARGDVAICKGIQWVEQPEQALVHRSPPVAAGEQRLLLRIDRS